MKNYKLHIGMLLVALFSLVSCQEKEEFGNVVRGSFSLMANIENNETRTSVDETGNVTWVETDVIGVFGKQTKNAKFQSTGVGASVKFVGEMSTQDEPDLAYYPYNESASLDGNTLHFTLPAEYKYTGESNAPMLGIRQEDDSFAFKHLCGLLKVTVNNMPENAKRLFVVSESTDEKEAPFITGDVVVNDFTVDNATLCIKENGGYEISYELSSVKKNQSYIFYIPIPVGDYPQLSLNLEIDNGNIGFEKSISNMKIERAKLIDMELLDITDEVIEAKEVLVSIDLDNVDGLKVCSFINEMALEGNQCSVDVISDEFPQFIFVSDVDKTIMLSHGYYDESINKIDVKSTALALITMQPCFIINEREQYNILLEKIFESPFFIQLMNEVEKEIRAKNDIFLRNNENIYSLIDKIIENICNSSASRALVGELVQCVDVEPLTVRVDNMKNVVNIYNKEVWPTYDCQVFYGGNVVEEKLIDTTDNYYGFWYLVGLFNPFYNDKTHFGSAETFSLSNRGEYLFHCNMNTPSAIAHTTIKIIDDIITLCGFGGEWKNVSKWTDFREKVIKDLLSQMIPLITSNKSLVEKSGEAILLVNKYIFQEMINIDAELSNDTYYFHKLVEENGETIIEMKKAINWRKVLASSVKICNFVSVGSNTLNRLAAFVYCLNNIPSLEFKLCKYDKITCCTKFILEKKESADNQIGKPNEKLKESLMVGVRTEDGCEVKLDNYQKVKFEIVSGDGFLENQKFEYKELIATSTIDWTLGNSGEQKVKVVVYDEKLDIELSEPVYFTASFEPEEEEGIITTDKATQITKTSATLFGNIQGYEVGNFMYRYGICYSTDTTPTASNGKIVYSNNIQENGDYSAEISSLTENTTYYYRAFVKDGGNYVYGDIKSFTTKKTKEKFDSLREALIYLYNTTGGENWNRNTNWCSDMALEYWDGIAIDENGYHINLFENNLNGQIDITFPDDVRLELNVGNNFLTSVDVSGSTSLFRLGCSNILSGTKLISLSVEGCTSLKSLSCGYNQLTSLDVSGLPALETLSCDNNQLTSLDVSGCKSLRSLTFTNNPITSIDVSNCTSLEKLDCNRYDSSYQDFMLNSLDVSGCVSLKELSCEEHNLTSLDISSCISLEILFCSFNKLTSLDYTNCTSLKQLQCISNNITSEIPDWTPWQFFHDARYTYWEEKDENGEYVTKYKDNGVGWWYRGEPESGKHKP